MLSISGAMSPSDGLSSYFTGSEDYYLSSPGRWHGQGAAALGLTGVVTREQFSSMAQGIDPGSGRRLVPGKESINSDGKNIIRKQAGNDLTFSAGKSVSIVSIFDPKIKKIHEQAVSKIVDFIEKNNIQARQQKNGRREITDSGNLVAAKFTHLTSRQMDPQLHTHVFLFNVTQRSDGQWRALYNRSIFKDKMALGKLYRNELAHGLQQAGYGIEITDRQEGYFRIRGIPQELDDHFSNRRKEIEARVKDPKFQQKYPNASRSQLYQIATLGTRATKQAMPAEKIKNHWQREITSQGYNIKFIKNDIYKYSNKDHQLTENTEKSIIKSVKDITENKSVFGKALALKTAAEQSFGRYTIVQLDKAFASSSHIIQLPKNHVNQKRYTSKEMLKIEQSVIRLAKNGQGKRQPFADLQEVEAAIARREKHNGWQYTAGQRAAIAALATGKDRVMVVQGDAGTGKTAAMSIFNHLAKSKGYTVLGLGFTGKSADELRKGAGIPARTIDSFLKRNQSGKKGKEIWLVDESSMAGSRHFENILSKAEKQQATVVFVGDTKQFESITAGRMYNNLQQHIGVHAKMTEVMRQKNQGLRAVVADFNRGDVDKAFHRLQQQNKITEYRSSNDLQRAAVQRYCRAATHGQDAVVITSTNSDRRQINKKIKDKLVQDGHLGQGRDYTILTPHNVSPAQAGLVSAYQEGQVVQIHKSFAGLKAGQSGIIAEINHHNNTIILKASNKSHIIDMTEHHANMAVYNREKISLSPGDRIAFTKNDQKIGVKNGQTGTIAKIDAAGNIIVNTGKNKVRFSLSQQQPGSGRYTYQHIDHGMAITAHKSQGATYNKVIWHAPTKKGRDRQINRRSAYVAATRARNDFEVLTDDKQLLQDAAKKDNAKESVLDVLRDAAEQVVEIGKDMVKEKEEEVEIMMS